MSSIVPAILTPDPAKYHEQIDAASKYCKRVQIDVSDGSFAGSTLIPLEQLTWPEGLAVDLHLMMAHPLAKLDQVIQLKPSLCIVHVEIEDDLVQIITKLQAANIKAGLALLKGSYPGNYRDLLTMANHALIFAGELGQQGGAADMLQTKKADLLRAIKSDIEIGWDGGANLENIRALAHADIDVINVGSAISGAPDKAAAYQELIVESEKKGVLI